MDIVEESVQCSGLVIGLGFRKFSFQTTSYFLSGWPISQGSFYDVVGRKRMMFILFEVFEGKAEHMRNKNESDQNKGVH